LRGLKLMRICSKGSHKQKNFGWLVGNGFKKI